MIRPQFLYDTLAAHGINFYAGVPDSLLKNICAYITDHADERHNIIAANEGGAMGLAAGHFTYIEDPDGTLIEMVEIHKIPIINKPNISINLMKRDRTKRLPTLLFRMMKLNKVKFKNNG